MAAFRDEGITSSTSDSSSMSARLRASASGACTTLRERGMSLGDEDRCSNEGAACVLTEGSRAGSGGGGDAVFTPSDPPLWPVGEEGGDEPGDDACSMTCGGGRSGVADTSILADARASCASVRCRLLGSADVVRAIDEGMDVDSGADVVRCRLAGRTSRRDMTTSLLMRLEVVKDERFVVRSACRIECFSCGAGADSGTGAALAEYLRFQGRRRVGVRDGPGAKHLDRNVAHIRGARRSKYRSTTSAQNHCASSRSSCAV